ncbi:flagellar biosynthetic protein FliO [Pseudomonas sp. P7]|jgi:flagellar protein FliO/FliZ|uniref:Flagellar protein n=1 Tax=Pseudomonas sivasensis TaxID=1880678 RepID=A0ABW8E0U7_9PSED|nr:MULTISPECIES: flagellar biosynthetic protein FliO [Pseudomonas]EZP65710.1 flagellar protein FliO [Pseudomonas sp. RIT357]MBA2923184.1 flagellar biosynthetic protein FliO [Pseudomonas sivasensis]MBA2928370.1 flagellar biosynthetic protein FliO [Pseudomonas sivasensis]MCT4496400.1 flagellar biosynthetic protein FliO [Pseudomonas sivasensis]OYT81395.1 MAG: flagellar biosynthetic protein FliO [Pseudomonas sp. PGPPP2]
MKRLMVGLLVALPLGAWAAEPVAQAAAAAAPVGSGLGGQLTQLVLGLLLVVGLIFVLAWLLRRVQQVGPGNAQVIEMIGSRALGPRDRLVLVQVGEEQILLGLTPGRITPLHVLKTPVNVDQSKPATPEFAQRLMELLGKDQKDKK